MPPSSAQGWIASGLYPKPEELEAGIKFYRDAGGKRAVLSNVIIDLHGNAEDMPLGGKASVMLTGGEAAARDRLQWIRDVGFDDVLCMATPGLARRSGPAARRACALTLRQRGFGSMPAGASSPGRDCSCELPNGHRRRY